MRMNREVSTAFSRLENYRQWVRNRHVIDELKAGESNIDDTSGNESGNDGDGERNESDSEHGERNRLEGAEQRCQRERA